jgi:H+-transporting ATPase
VPPKAGLEEEEEEEEDMDALIEELESEDAAIDYEEDEVAQPGGARVVPEEMLQTDTRTGLTDSEVQSRRKKYGLNQMKGECFGLGCCNYVDLTNARNRGEGELDP